MTNLVNMQRDSSFGVLNEASQIAFSGTGAIGNTNFPMSGQAAVQDIFASQQSALAPTVVTAGNWRGMGVYMKPPGVDATPYRIKARATSAIQPGYHFIIGRGYAPASPTGSNDLVTDPLFLSFIGEFDDIVILPKVLSTDPNFGLPLGIAVLVIDPATIGSTNLIAHISVQNLAISPPAFAQSIS